MPNHNYRNTSPWRKSVYTKWVVYTYICINTCIYMQHCGSLAQSIRCVRWKVEPAVESMCEGSEERCKKWSSTGTSSSRLAKFTTTLLLSLDHRVEENNTQWRFSPQTNTYIHTHTYITIEVAKRMVSTNFYPNPLRNHTFINTCICIYMYAHIQVNVYTGKKIGFLLHKKCYVIHIHCTFFYICMFYA